MSVLIDKTYESKAPYIFSVDAESLGLYGTPFAVGAVVIEKATEKEVANFYGRCPVEILPDYSPEHSSLEWLTKNVIPHLGPVTHETTNELYNAFWTFYTTWRSQCDIVGDCLYPVEANLFMHCVKCGDPSENRQWKAPYPFHELATKMMLKGKDPNKTYSRLENELPVHNAIADARQSARLWLWLDSKPDELKPID